MGCADIIRWPAGILKCFHLLFNLAIFVCAIYYYKPPKGDHSFQLFNEYAFGILVWIIISAFMLMGSIVTLITFIFTDGVKWKNGFLAYYSVGCSLACVGMIIGGLIIDRWTWRGSIDPYFVTDPHTRKKIARPDCFYVWMTGTLISIFSFATYLGSAILNGSKDKP